MVDRSELEFLKKKTRKRRKVFPKLKEDSVKLAEQFRSQVLAY